MREGAAQVVMLPVDVVDFREAINMVALQFGYAASQSQVIAVTGAHGGVGSTMLAVNLAYELAHSYQLDTIVAELSLNFGVFASYLAIEPEYTTLELLQHAADIDIYITSKALIPFGERLSVLAGPVHAVTAPDVTPLTIARLIDDLRQLAQVVILDVPSTLDDAQLATLSAADEVVLVTDHTVPSIHMSAEALRFGIRAHSPWVVVNRFDSEIGGLDVDHIKNILAIDSLRTLTLDHEAVNGSINCGQPLRLCYPKSKALADIHALAKDLLKLKQPVNPVAKTAGLMSRFGHALGFS
jgi:pilus assembly protein CpaE